MPYCKFGIHAAGVGGVYDNLDAYLARCQSTGAPAIIQAVDNAGPALAAQSLGRDRDVIVFRMVQRDGVSLESTNYQAEPVAFARSRMQAIARYWPTELNRAKVWTAPVNEPSKEPGDIEWLAAFTLECARISIANGWRHLAYGWSAGTPEADFWQLPDVLAYLQLCAQRPDLLGVSLHEYGLDDNITDSAPWLVGRFSFLHAACDQNSIPYPPIVVGEFGWREASLRPSPQPFRQQLEWAQQQYGPYDNILGAAIWTLGRWSGTVASDFSQLIPALLTMVSDYGYTPPPDPPEPPDCCNELRTAVAALRTAVTDLEARVALLEQPVTPPPPPPPTIPDPASTNGVDISQWQIGMNWPVFKNGLGFIYIKAGSGATPTDPQFANHWRNAAGVLRGAYWYQYPDRAMPAAQQAAEFYGRIRDLNSELPPMLDVEENGLTRGMVQAFVTAFAAVSGGMMLGIYTSASKWNQLTGNLPLPDYPLWVAHWTSAPRPIIPPTWTSWTFWQYTSDGTRPGYNGRLDLNRYNGTVAQLGAFARSWPRAGWNPGTPPPPPPSVTVDLQQYFEPDGDVGQFTVFSWLDGSRTQDQQLRRVAGGSVVLVKGTDYERWRMTSAEMQRAEDTSMGNGLAYTQNWARWLPRVVGVGETYINTPRVTVRRRADCSIVSDMTTTDYLTVVALHATWQSPANQNITLRNVLEIHWRKSPNGAVQERYFIAPRLAYVAWGRGNIEAAISEVPQGRPPLAWQSWGCG